MTSIYLSWLQFVLGNTLEFGVFWLTQVDVATFPPRHHAFRGHAIVNNFHGHMKLLCKLWVFNNMMPNYLCISSCVRLNVANLYAIRLHIESSWP